MIVETFGAIAGTLGFLALVIGAVMFIPIAALKRRRRIAKILAIGGAIAFVIGLVLTPNPEKDGKPAPKQVASAKNDSAPTLASTEQAEKAAAQERFISLYHQVIAEAKPCDEASSVLQKAANSGDSLATYQAAKNGRDTCRAATMAMGKVEPPSGLTDAGEAATKKALGTCENAYLYRQMGMEKAMAVADGDNRPSAISEMIEHMKTGQAGTLLCVAQLLDAAVKSHINIKKLSQ